MKKLIKLFFLLTILSVGLYSCFPLYPNRYGSQGYGGQEYRGRGSRDYGYSGQGYRGHGERHNRHHDRSGDRGDYSYNSPHN